MTDNNPDKIVMKTKPLSMALNFGTAGLGGNNFFIFH
jgi:hypothetical protein